MDEVMEVESAYKLHDGSLFVLPSKETRDIQAMLYKRLSETTLSVNLLKEHKHVLEIDICIVVCRDCESNMRFEPKVLGVVRTSDVSSDDRSDMIKTNASCIQSGVCPCDRPVQDKAALRVHGCRLAHLAAMEEEHLPILIYLAKIGCNLEALTHRFKQSPLVVSIYFNRLETFKYLMSLNVNVNVSEGKSIQGGPLVVMTNSVLKEEAPLSAAIHFERDEMIKILLASDEIHLNCSDMNGQPLLVNCVRLHPEFVESLLEAGANPNVTGSNANTSLMFAITHRDTELVEMLIKYGADVNLKNKRNEVALLIAIYNENIDLVRILLEAGADANYATDTELNPLLLLASYDGCVGITKLLIKHGANVKACNNLGYTALHIAAWNGHTECVKMLLEAGALHDQQTKDMNTPLALAAHGKHLPVFKLLLPLGCNVNNSDKDQDTPLHYAAYNGMAKACELLIKYGADPNCRNKVDSTPLWNAVYQKHKEVVKLLLVMNVKLETVSIGIDQHSHTDHVVTIYPTPRSPLWVAVERDCTDIALLLVTAGYNVHNEKWLVNSEFPPHAINIRFNAILSQYVHSTPRLVALCRNFFRHYFGIGIGDKVAQLQIPKSLKNYLTLSDLKYCTDEDESGRQAFVSVPAEYESDELDDSDE